MRISFILFIDREHLVVSDLKKDFVVVVVILDAEILSKFPQNWFVLRLEKICSMDRSFLIILKIYFSLSVKIN